MDASNNQTSSPLQIEDCYRHVFDEIFVLRSKSYEQVYPNWPGEVGIELEMLAVKSKENGSDPTPLILQGPAPNTLASVLRTLAGQKDWQLIYEDNESTQKLLTFVKMDKGDFLSFEPGGQLEFSSKPYPCLSDAVRRLATVQTDLDQAFTKNGFELIQLGGNPWHSVSDIGLQMPKPRYVAMSDYFNRIGVFGLEMMRLTCSLQVCLDFGSDEATMIKRFLASQYLAPFAAAIFAYSPYMARSSKGCKTYRSRIWRYLDPTRTGIYKLDDIVKTFTKASCVESYLDFALDAQVVFIKSAHYKVADKPITFRQWLTEGLDGIYPNLDDFKLHLTLLFPEVRPKGFLELRSIDCQARAWQVVPASFYCGLLYDRTNLEWLIEKLVPIHNSLNELLHRSEQGLDDLEIQELACQLFSKSIEGFSRLPSCFRGEGSEKILELFGQRFTLAGRTPADDILDLVKKKTAPYPSLRDYRNLESEWLTFLS